MRIHFHQRHPKCLRLLAAVLLFLSVVTHVDAQEQTLRILLKTFDDFRKVNLQEKIYLHTDRAFYVTGETMWFKVYNVEAILHSPSAISKVAYIELLNDRGVSTLQGKVQLANGAGSGSLYIPAALGSGNYTLRAYTHWMKNFPAELFFTKTISVVNPFVKPERAKPDSRPAVIAEFFPEGGNLVAGILNNVAFRITGADGRGIDAKGLVFTTTGDTVTSFSSQKFGLGTFQIVPQADRKYHVKIVDADNRVSMHALPDAQPAGYAMNLKDASENTLEIEVTAAPARRELTYIYVLAHTRQMIGHAEVLPLQNNKAVVTIDKSKLGAGVSHITVFDNNLSPVCERLYFKFPQPLNVSVKTDQQQYGVRRRVNTGIEVSSPSGTSPDMSVAIVRVDSLSDLTPGNIGPYLWLSSDIKGKVESPEYYFSGAPGSQGAIDLVMLTHGWRRFKWDAVLNKRPDIAFAPEYRGHIIQARVTDAKGQPVSGITTYMASPDKVINLYASVSNKKGLVKFEAPKLFGSRKIILQTAHDTTVQINLEDPFSTAGSTAPEPLVLNRKLEEALIERTIAMQVQDIYYDHNREGIQRDAADSTAFYGRADETYYLDEYTRFPVMEEVMREYVPGVLVRKRRDGFHFLVVDAVNKSVLQGDPLILLDGVPVKDADDIMKVDPRKVRKLEVITRPYFLGPVALKGIVSYTTYGGDLAGFELNPDAVSINYEGLQIKREFYAPRYENEAIRNDRLPDQRSLLFWNPSITGRDGKAAFDFFTSDQEGTFVILVEGLTAAGEAGSASCVFTVKRFDN